MITTEETMTIPALPETGDLGAFGTWTLPLDNDETEIFEGYFLGVSSSRRPNHENHDGSEYGTAGTWTGDQQRCGACRWFEPRIFIQAGDDHPLFGLHKRGVSIVPGERDRSSFERAGSAMELIQLLTVTKNGKAVLTIPGRRVLAQASGYDDEIKRAYMDWRASE